jgi:hypothetical protein
VSWCEPDRAHEAPCRCFAQRAFWAAAIFARADADIRRGFLPRLPVIAFLPRCFAHRALCAAAIRALPAADILRPLRGLPTRLEEKVPLLNRTPLRARKAESICSRCCSNSSTIRLMVFMCKIVKGSHAKGQSWNYCYIYTAYLHTAIVSN